ncbi:MAG: MraY family glycosyltransferase [Myxococcota bacterium]
MLLWTEAAVLAGSFVLSLGLGLWLTPRVRAAALRFGVLDQPNQTLKTHREPVAYLGGIAVYLAFLIALSLIFEFRGELLGLLLGSTLIVMLGLFDDLRAISPGLKLAGQLLAAWVTLRSGITIELVAVPLAIAIPASVIWIIGVSNAFNIIDVSDGLSTGTAAVASIGFALIAILDGDVILSATCLALAGATFGFLRYNREPASIYLGDAGSLFVGFLLACLALIGSYTSRNVFAAASPILILGVPIFDTVLCSVARIAKGISPMNGSDDHFAIRLKAAGWSARAVARSTMGATAIGVIASLVMVTTPASVAAVVLLGFVLAFVGTLLVIYFAFPTPTQRRALQERAVSAASAVAESDSLSAHR